MKFSIYFSKVASLDLLEASTQYEDKREGSGFELLEEVRDRIEMIKQTPFIFPIRYEEYRYCNLKVFPYKIIYSIEASTISVWAIYHHKRDPASWRR